jgi:TonB family protein
MGNVIAVALTFFGFSSPVVADASPCAQPHVDVAVITKAEADYPDMSRLLGEVGTVTVRIRLSPTGEVLATRVYRSSGHLLLDEAALKAARASTYRAEVNDCRSVSGEYLFVVSYTASPEGRTPKPVIDTSSARLPTGSIELAGIHLSDISAWTGDGVRIDFVHPGSPAYLAGLRAGDVIMEVDGTLYRNAAALNEYLNSRKRGDVVHFSVWQYGVKSPSYVLNLP